VYAREGRAPNTQTRDFAVPTVLWTVIPFLALHPEAGSQMPWNHQGFRQTRCAQFNPQALGLFGLPPVTGFALPRARSAGSRDNSNRSPDAKMRPDSGSGGGDIGPYSANRFVACGHELVERSLLRHGWTAGELSIVRADPVVYPL